jgi:hypothetical protein
MTDLQKMRARALGQATICKGTPSKRFVEQLAYWADHQSDRELSPKQAAFLACLCWTFRRQIPASLVPAENPYPQADQ